MAHELNPSASWQALVLNDEMVRRGRTQLPALAREMRENVDSGDVTFYRDWFRSAGQREDIPNRVGYYLGYRVARTLGREHDLAELAALRDPELRKRIEEALLALEREAS